MAICSITSSVRAGLVLAVPFIALWVSAGAFRVPAGLTGRKAVTTLPGDSAEEMGFLDTQEASPGGEICALAVSPDGTLLATGTRDGAVRLWEASSQRPLGRWQAHEEAVTALAFFPDSRDLLTSGADQTIGRWLVREASVPRLVGRWSVAAHVSALAVAPGGRTLAMAAGGGLGLYDTERGDFLPGSELSVPDVPLRALAFAPDGRSLAGGGGGDNAVRVWGLGAGRPVLRLTLGGYTDNWLRGLAYTEDGCTLVSLDTAGRLLAWDRAGNLLAEARAGPPPCLHVALGTGGKLLLTATGREGPARLSRLPDDWWR
jgi:WD40 repeat protein